MTGYTRQKYFKPGDFIHNASNFNKVPIEKSYRQNSVNMVEEAKMKKSMQATMKRTNVWRKDTMIFKLNGLGASNAAGRHGSQGASSLGSYDGSSISKYERRETGHMPTTTVRDKDLFS